VLLALVRHAAAAGARHIYLQVSADNAPAIALYTGLGLTVHHDYHYRRARPTAADPPDGPGELC
jgi:ribosomal protein S18 acetylase RimI-like enzyme